MDRTGRSNRPAHWLPPIRLRDEERPTTAAGRALPALPAIASPRPARGPEPPAARIRVGLPAASSAGPAMRVRDPAVEAMTRRFLSHGATFAAMAPATLAAQGPWDAAARERIREIGLTLAPGGQGSRNQRVVRALLQSAAVPPAEVEAAMNAILQDRGTRPDALGEALRSGLDVEADPRLFHAMAEQVFGPGRMPPMLVARGGPGGTLLLRDPLGDRHAPNVHPATVTPRAAVMAELQGDFALVRNTSGYPWNMVLGALSRPPRQPPPAAIAQPAPARHVPHGGSLHPEDEPLFVRLRASALEARRLNDPRGIRSFLADLRAQGTDWDGFAQRPAEARERYLREARRHRGLDTRAQAAVRWALRQRRESAPPPDLSSPAASRS